MYHFPILYPSREAPCLVVLREELHWVMHLH